MTPTATRPLRRLSPPGLLLVPPFVKRTDLACTDPDVAALFYGGGEEEEDGRSSIARKAIARCYACPALDECRDWAVRRRESGIWGGTTAAERETIRKGEFWWPRVIGRCPRCRDLFAKLTTSQRYCSATCRNTSTSTRAAA